MRSISAPHTACRSRHQVDRVMPGAASNSMPPARSCDSISGSPPSWLLGKTVIFSRPDDCAPIARAASVNRAVSGWVSGVLTPSLNSNSATALAGLFKTVAARAPDVAPSNPLRVIFIFLVSRAHRSRLPAVSAEPAPSARCAAARKAALHPQKPAEMPEETILGSQRNHLGGDTKRS